MSFFALLHTHYIQPVISTPCILMLMLLFTTGNVDEFVRKMTISRRFWEYNVIFRLFLHDLSFLFIILSPVYWKSIFYTPVKSIPLQTNNIVNLAVKIHRAVSTVVNVIFLCICQTTQNFLFYFFLMYA